MAFRRLTLPSRATVRSIDSFSCTGLSKAQALFANGASRRRRICSQSSVSCLFIARPLPSLHFTVNQAHILPRSFSTSAAPPPSPSPQEEPADMTNTAKALLESVKTIEQRQSNRQEMKERFDRLSLAVNEADLWDNPEQAQKLIKEYQFLKNKMEMTDKLKGEIEECIDLIDLAAEEKDSAVLEECRQTLSGLAELIRSVEVESLLQETEDILPCFIEIQAGAGGKDSRDWTEMLAEMYFGWAKRMDYSVSIYEVMKADEGGFRSILFRVDGAFAFGWAKAEIGVHRLVRISPFDPQKRRHTSFAQVRIYPAVDEESNVIEISPKDIKVDTYRSSGPGGQHVNTTDSAVRITHIPSGIVVTNQNERSQHRNRAAAMEVLKARLLDIQIQKKQAEKRAIAKMAGDNTWGSQIRSYILDGTQQLVKDHRTGTTSFDIEGVLKGEIETFMETALAMQASQYVRIENEEPESS